MQHNSVAIGINLGLRVDRECQAKGFEEGWLDLPDKPKSGAELGMYRSPGHRGSTAKCMEAVGEPDVDINGQTSRANGPDGFLSNRHRMLAERAPETRIEPNPVLPERRLIIIGDTGERDRVLDESAVVGGPAPSRADKSARRC